MATDFDEIDYPRAETLDGAGNASDEPAAPEMKYIGMITIGMTIAKWLLTLL
jgi:hypothetical protein